MNYLAHATLSFGLPEILVGNIISDFVKGKQKFSYAPGIQQGITLHRLIDAYTDQHPVTGHAKKIFQPYYRLYSAAYTDVLFDHFLAMDTDRYSEEGLMEFSQETYKMLESYAAVFPDRFAAMFPYMKKQNWLFNYRHRTGIRRSFEGLAYRAKYMDESDTAFALFEENYDLLGKYFSDFYPDLENYAREQLQEILQ